MSIEKVTTNLLKHSGLSFTTIINETMNSIKDPATLGIYLYLASKPDKWIIRSKDIQNRFDKGREFVENRLSELKKLGLMKSYPVKNDKGIITHWETVLLNNLPIHNTAFPESGKTTPVEKQAYINKRLLEIKDDIEIKEKISCSSSDERVRNDHCFVSQLEMDGRENTVEVNELEQGFDDFWGNYPKKVGKGKCLKIWVKNNLHKKSSQIISDIGERKRNNWLGKHKQYIPDPSTYLNQERWNDEIIMSEVKQEKFDAGKYLMDQIRKSAHEEQTTNPETFYDVSRYLPKKMDR